MHLVTMTTKLNKLYYYYYYMFESVFCRLTGIWRRWEVSRRCIAPDVW